MSDSTICLTPIRKLLTDDDGKPARYWIRAYQRGYRWTPLQVRQLLDDIWDFVQEPKGPSQSNFYCLQPLVVKVHPDGRIEVVDGQQRLTTIHIILTCLKNMASLLTSTFFCLTFETRDDATRPSLDQIELDREMENIDYYHICQAFRAVQKWCDDHPQPQQLKLLQHLLNDDSGRNVQVIRFELGKNDKPVDAFTRLNVGKIRLTNDELIRALFLGRGRQEHGADDSLKDQIAYEWDIMEKELQAADFWAFLTDQDRKQNRIGFLFELIAGGVAPGEEDDEYRVFYRFSQKLGEAGQTLRNVWLEIKREFMRLHEWFEDERRITYHLVGYLVTQSVGLSEIRELSTDCTKSEFELRLRARVYRTITGAVAIPPEAELNTRLTEYLGGLEYGRHSQRIRSVLLLFNIATLLENKNSNLRFQFEAFKDDKYGWDLEHIRSVASERIPDHTVWLTDCLRFIETQTTDDELVPSIKDFLAPSIAAKTDEEFDELHARILKYFGEGAEHEERNDLANLTLLDSRTNRSYQNAPFAMKRHKILSLDKSGVFVPLCTRNVFLKCYSEPPGNPIFWTDADCDSYQQAILNTLTGFFLGKNTQ